MKRFTLAVLLVAGCNQPASTPPASTPAATAARTAADPSGTPSAVVDVRIAFKGRGPGKPGTMRIFELGAQRPVELWETKVVPTLADAPLGPEIADGRMKLAPGSAKNFVLVLENPGTEAVHFFAAPHVVDPPEYSLGFKFKCLCINHAFSVDAGKVWYRAVKLTLSKEFVGDAMDIVHDLIPTTADRAGQAPMPGMVHEGSD